MPITLILADDADTGCIQREKTMKKIRLTSAAAAMLIAAAAPASVVDWLYAEVEMTASWSGGDPIDGQTSGSESWHFEQANPNPSNTIYGNVGLNSRLFFAYSQYLYVTPQGGSDVNFGITYNANTGSGFDTSTHTFGVSFRAETIYELADPGVLNGFEGGAYISPYSYSRIEQGTWDGTTFTPTSTVMDLASINVFQSTPTSPGFFRFSADITTTFDANGTFDLHNYANWRHNSAVPEPATLAAVGIGTISLLRRRRRAR